MRLLWSGGLCIIGILRMMTTERKKRRTKPGQSSGNQRRVDAGRIRELRLRLEMSVRDLARKTKIDPFAITDWEDGALV